MSRPWITSEGRAEIGEEIHLLPQAQEAALRAQREGQALPFRPADRAEQHGIRLQRPRHRVVMQRRAMRLVSGAADEILGEIEAGDPLLVEPFGDADDLVHHLRPDTVTGQDEDLLVRCHRLLLWPASPTGDAKGNRPLYSRRRRPGESARGVVRL